MTYSLSQLAWFFLIYSILGWCISVAFCAVKKHSFVNPGFLNLPVSPIYGIGAVLSTVFLSELTHRPLFFILGSCVLSGILVITTGVALERMLHRRWWDFSDHKFHFHGYISLPLLLVLGVGAWLCVSFLNPLLALVLGDLPPLLSRILVLVGLGLVALDLPFLRKSMGGICTTAAQRGYDLLLCYAEGADTRQLERQLSHHKMDGVILSRTLQDDPCIELLRQFRVPFVAIGRTEDPSIPQVDNDQASASQEMTRLLLQLGLRRIALLTGSPMYYVNRDRAKGYMDAMAQWGVQPDPGLIHTGIETDVQRIDALEAVLERRSDCILCGDDRLAFDVSLELQARQIRVPDQMRVASLYDSELTAGLNPGISAVQFDAEALGGAACRMLLDLMAGKESSRQVVMGHQVILRDSTKMTPGR